MDITTVFGTVVPGSSPGGGTMEKSLPFTKDQIETLANEHPTPFYIYDEQGIRKSARALIDAFTWNVGFKEYFAVKATPNPTILRILAEEGCGADASSLAELVLCEKVGIVGENIIFTSNDTPLEEFSKAKALGALINLDDLSHLAYIEESIGLPDVLSFRYNPGGEGGNLLIGNPQDAKFGLTRPQLIDAYGKAKAAGVSRFGLHAMIACNKLDVEYFVQNARMLFEIATEVKGKHGIELEFINLGGGIGIPYVPGEREIDIRSVSEGIRREYEAADLSAKLFMECGRYLTGPHGYLVSRVRHIKDTYKLYAGLDASMANLMRPGMYGAYHHISVLGREGEDATHTYDVTGSLCENNDKFAIDRPLPELSRGDVLVIHDAGAHGHSMGFTYNGKLRSAEFLLTKGEFTMIRRAETLEDHFATLNF